LVQCKHSSDSTGSDVHHYYIHGLHDTSKSKITSTKNVVCEPVLHCQTRAGSASVFFKDGIGILKYCGIGI